MTSSLIEDQDSVEMEIEEEEEEEDDNNIVGSPLTPQINQIDDSSSVDSAPTNDQSKNPHSSTPQLFQPNTAKAFLEDMTDRKHLIEPVNYKLDATQIAESSSLLEPSDSNKRPAIVCSFFAKGWCIKGKSCRFLHIRDEASEGTQKCEHPLGKASSLAEVSALDDGEILKQKNEVRGSLKGVPGFNVFLAHETWPMLSGGQQMSSFSTSWKRDPSQIQKCLDSDPKYQASETLHFQHHSFPSSGSGLQNLPTTKQSAECKTTLFGNWEPSIPFQPSHILTQRLLSNAKRCNAIRDNVQQTHIRDKVSQCGQEAFGESDNVYAKTHANSVETLCQKYESSNNFISGSNFYSKEIQKDSSKIQSVNAETSAERQKCSLLTGNESSLNSMQSRSIVGADLVDVNDSEPCTDRQSHTTQPKVDFVGQENGADVDLKSDANAHKESKELKIFHAALVERVKELLRQPWHDGLLSKDVYKLIVKKAVDKVISTMEPDQVPVSTESIKQYFSLFKGKLTKLIEAYVDKYGKSLPGCHSLALYGNTVLNEASDIRALCYDAKFKLPAPVNMKLGRFLGLEELIGAYGHCVTCYS